MPDDDTTVEQKDRHTGEAASFLARARRAASERVIAANQARTDAVAAAQWQAQEARDAAHTLALQTLGQDLKNVCITTEDALVVRDATGAAVASLPATGAANVAVDAVAERVYWARFGLGDGIALAPDGWSGELRRGEVALYPGAGYEGRPWICTAGVPDFTRVPGLNDRVCSLRVGPDTAVTLFEHVGMGGQYETFNTDMPELYLPSPGTEPYRQRERAGWTTSNPTRWRQGFIVPNMASALELRARDGMTAQGQATVYEHAGYGGGYGTVDKPGLADFNDSRGEYGWISSVRPGPNTAVTLYSAPRFGGRAQRFVADVGDLQGSYVGNDSVLSLKIEPFSELQLVSAKLDGSGVSVVAHVPLFGSDSPFAGSVAVDPALGLVFWALTSGVILRADGSGHPPVQIHKVTETPNPQRWELTIDTINRKLYVTDVDAVVRIDYDGSNRWVVMLRPWMPPVTNEELLTGAPIAIAIDGQNGFLYASDQNRVWRARLDGSNPERLRLSSSSCEGVAIDVATQMLYWTENGLMLRMRVGDGTSPDSIFPVPDTTGRVLNVALVTASGAAGERLLSAHANRQSAQAEAARSVDQAHRDATGARQQAQAGLQRAHDDAASAIGDAQRSAASQRQDAQASVDQARSDATAQIAAAKTAADATRRDAVGQGQSIEADGRQKADGIRQSAQQDLDAARRKQQG